jgi:hypothetical protein
LFMLIKIKKFENLVIIKLFFKINSMEIEDIVLTKKMTN